MWTGRLKLTRCCANYCGKMPQPLAAGRASLRSPLHEITEREVDSVLRCPPCVVFGHEVSLTPLKKARPVGFEPTTLGSEGHRSKGLCNDLPSS